jgi:hypothetical protein
MSFCLQKFCWIAASSAWVLVTHSNSLLALIKWQEISVLQNMAKISDSFKYEITNKQKVQFIKWYIQGYFVTEQATFFLVLA